MCWGVLQWHVRKTRFVKFVNTNRYTASRLQKPTLLLFIRGQHTNKPIPGELITESNADCMYHN